jgi:hypothetical protein
LWRSFQLQRKLKRGACFSDVKLCNSSGPHLCSMGDAQGKQDVTSFAHGILGPKIARRRHSFPPCKFCGIMSRQPHWCHPLSAITNPSPVGFTKCLDCSPVQSLQALLEGANSPRVLQLCVQHAASACTLRKALHHEISAVFLHQRTGLCAKKAGSSAHERLFWAPPQATDTSAGARSARS